MGNPDPDAGRWPGSRELPLVPERAALLLVDVQNFNARPDGGEYAARGRTPAEAFAEHREFFERVRGVALPAMQRLLRACRAHGVEVIYTVIESLTLDGRDRSLDYKITGFHVPRGSWDARVLDEVRPEHDEMVLPKTSSSPFVSTNLDYLLRNLGVAQLVVAGFVTDQCISSTVRDACDRGYLVTLVPDACASYTRERHEHAIAHIAGYCRQRSSEALVAELEGGLEGAAPDGDGRA